MRVFTLPFLLRNAHVTEIGEFPFSYEDSLHLNVQEMGPKLVPAVVGPSALARLKTITESKGSNED